MLTDTQRARKAAIEGRLQTLDGLVEFTPAQQAEYDRLEGELAEYYHQMADNEWEG